MSDKFDIRETEVATFDDEMSVERAQNTKGTALRLLKDLMRQRWKFIVVFLSIIITSVLTVLSPRLIGEAINQIFDGIKAAAQSGIAFQVNGGAIGRIMLLLLGVYLLNTLFYYIQQYVMSSVSQTLSLSMRKAISNKLNRLPLSYFDRHKKGEVLSRATSDLEKVADTLQDSMTQLLTAVVGIAGAFLMMLTISPLLTLIALATVFVSMVVSALISSRTLRHYMDNQQALGKLNSSVEEAFTGNLVVKTFHMEDRVAQDTEELSEELYQASRRAQFITYVINPIVRLVNQCGYVLIAVRGAMAVIRGSISIGDIQAFFQYVNQISEPLTQLSYTINSLQGAIAAAERVYQLLDEEDEVREADHPALLPTPRGDVRFEHVRFGYRDDEIIMQDINFQAAAGSRIAIVGPTGAGKTTLINLLMRFYELQGGKISIDGINIAQMSRHGLRTYLGMVLQDTWLFHGTIGENIAYGRPDATEEDIRRAARAARADHFIRTLPEGYHTVLDDEVSSLSQGQRQLLTIARAILADPTILILDEATSSVDTRTEQEIQKAMDTLMRGRTSFIIAHRLSTIRDADHILVMRDGTIIEQGSHDELMKQDGFYADLYNSQFGGEAA